MATLTRAAAPATTGHSALRITTRVLLALFGALKLYGTTYFLFFASAAQGGDPQGAFDWTVGVWSYVMGASYVLIALRLGRDRRVLPLAVGISVADLGFSVVKFFVYGETTAIGFAATTLVLLALVVLASRSRRS